MDVNISFVVLTFIIIVVIILLADSLIVALLIISLLVNFLVVCSQPKDAAMTREFNIGQRARTNEQSQAQTNANAQSHAQTNANAQSHAQTNANAQSQAQSDSTAAVVNSDQQTDLYGPIYELRHSYQNAYTECYDQPRPAGIDCSDRDNSVDAANMIMTQRRARDKKCIDGWVTKTADYYKYHFGGELDEEEAKVWWSKAEI